MGRETGKRWNRNDFRLPDSTDGDAAGKIFAWHVYQGVMLIRWDEYGRNRFFAGWMRMADGTGAWIDAQERAPTRADADVHSCILARTVYGETIVTGYHQIGYNGAITHWQRLPEGPERNTGEAGAHEHQAYPHRLRAGASGGAADVRGRQRRADYIRKGEPGGKDA